MAAKEFFRAQERWGALEVHSQGPPLIATLLELKGDEEGLLLGDLLIESLHHHFLRSKDGHI